MDDINIFWSIISTILRLHAPTFDHSRCMECEQNWPCRTVALVNSRPDSPYVEPTESQSAMELGFVLNHIDKRFTDEGYGGDSLVNAIHQLVLIPELSLSGNSNITALLLDCGIFRHHSRTSDASIGEKISINTFDRNWLPGWESMQAFTCSTGFDVNCNFHNKIEWRLPIRNETENSLSGK